MHGSKAFMAVKAISSIFFAFFAFLSCAGVNVPFWSLPAAMIALSSPCNLLLSLRRAPRLGLAFVLDVFLAFAFLAMLCSGQNPGERRVATVSGPAAEPARHTWGRSEGGRPSDRP